MRKPRTLRVAAAGIVAIALLLGGSGSRPTPEEAAVRQYADRALAGLRDGYFVGTGEWNRTLAEQLPVLRAAETVPATYAPLSRLTQAAGGRHSHFDAPYNVRANRDRYSSRSASVPAPSATFDRGIATLTIPEFSSAHRVDRDRFLARASDAFASSRARAACGWIIDLSGNGGGDPWAMIAAASPLLDDGVVSTFRTREGLVSGITVQGNAVGLEGRRWDADPIVDGRFGALDERALPGVHGPARLPGAPVKLADRPVAIVQSPMSASAAELLILAFAGQRNVRTFGTDTSGYTTMNAGFQMSDGAEATLSIALMGDRTGRVPDGAIPPDHPVDGDAGDARAAARSWIAPQCGGGGP